MLEAIPHRLVRQIGRADALEHDGKLKVAERHVVADPGNIPSGPARAPGGELSPGQQARAGGAVGPQAGARRASGTLECSASSQPSSPESVSRRSTSARSPPRPPPIQPACRNALGIPGGVLVTVMIYRIVERIERKILTPPL